MAVDVVIPLSNGSFIDDFELRYCLRSIERNLLDLGNVWIIGHRPLWCHGVKHIPFEDSYQDNKSANIINKIMRACMEDNLTNEFIRMSDDQCILTKMYANEILPVYNEDLKTKENWSDNRWDHLLKRTQIALERKGMTAFNYEPHIPLPVFKKLFLKTMIGWDYGAGIGYVTNSLYYNTIVHSHEKVDVSKRAAYFKPDLPIDLSGKKFLCYSDAGLSYPLMNAMKTMFPDKSRFEV